MTKRNIAIAIFSPEEFFNSSWPRFTGFKEQGTNEKPTGLFGLVDGSSRMHGFFLDTDIQTVIMDQLIYSQRETYHIAKALSIAEDGTITLPPKPQQPGSIQILSPYTFTQRNGTEWDVYPLVMSGSIFIKGYGRNFDTKGYWDMQIWKPKVKEGEEWTDTDRIEQSTINHVVSLGYPARTPITIFEDNPNYGKYQIVDVTAEVPA